MKKVYLDNAATTQIREEVIDRMQEALTSTFGNPSSSHSFGRTAKTEIEKARKIIAKELHAHPSEIIFTSGGTEADNMILKNCVRDHNVTTIITSKIEHHAVLHTAEELKRAYNVRVLYVDVDNLGEIDYKHLEQLLQADSSKKLVSLMHVNNEIGTLLDVQLIADLCIENNALFHSDTVQSIGHFKWDVTKTPIHFFTAAAHKFHGPKGVGFAYVRKEIGLKPFIFGGSQERGFRAGTEALHNIVGLETAFVEAYTNLEEERAYITQLKHYFITEIKNAIPGVKFNGASKDEQKSTYTLVSVCLPFNVQKSQMLLFHLDLKGIACSEGSACQSGSGSGSHVLSEVLSAEEMKLPSLRFSFSKFNTIEEIDYVIEELKQFALS